MDISKKDLLKETGISYGQLYRWKREGLIPETWFVKKSSYTGQETYFPREKILQRIQAIQQLKDQYSLEELANILSPEITNRMFSEEDLESFEEIDIEIAAAFMDAMEKDNFTFREVLIMIILSEWRLKEGIVEAEMKEMIQHMIGCITSLTSVETRFLLLRMQDHYYSAFLHDEQGKGKGTLLSLDDRIEIVREEDLQELGNSIKVKYKAQFKFAFDEEVIK